MTASTELVSAREQMNLVARVRGGVTYRIRPLPNQVWTDGWITCGPDGYEKWYLFPFRRWRRHSEASWFALVGMVGDEPPFEIGSGTVITPAKDAELFCFANDLPFMYWNNRGAITVTVTPAD